MFENKLVTYYHQTMS